MSVAALLLAATLSALPAADWCGTSEQNDQRLQELARWTEAREIQQRSKGLVPPSPNGVVSDGVVVLDADNVTAPFRRPFDLEGRSITFTRQSGDAFAITNSPLEYDDDRGSLWGLGRDINGVSISLKNEFPFYDRQVKNLIISPLFAIYTSNPAATSIDQYSDMEAIATREGVIAPFLTTQAGAGQGLIPQIYVKETEQAVTVTWVVTRTTIAYDIQAVLFRSGDIRFSYKTTFNIRAGALVVSSGTESWRREVTPLVASTDPAGDVPVGFPATIAPMLDIESLQVNRIADSNLLEVRMRMAGTIDRTKLSPTGQPVNYAIAFGDLPTRQTITFSLRGDGQHTYAVPGWGQKALSPAARIEDRELVLYVLQDYLAAVSGPTVRATVSLGGDFGDNTFGATTLAYPRRPVHTDFSATAFATNAIVNGPIVEAYTLPILNPAGVYSQIKALYKLDDTQYDSIAVYQNFLTDINLYASAYSTGGNPSVSGINPSTAVYDGARKTPSYLHMNKLGYGPNRLPEAASHVVLHELGHRWLLFIRIMENGQTVRSLNPLSAHPAQYIDTRAAFRVTTDSDSSVMGGGVFKDNGNGSFTSSAYGSYGYSWLDLYLMGLAEASEVQPFFYIANSNPVLGGAYYPPENFTVNGTRTNVTIQQVIDAMGQRKPSAESAQKTFRVLFVLLTDPDRPVTESEIAKVVEYRSILERDFRLATGGRGTVVTSFEAPAVPPRRRSLK